MQWRKFKSALAVNFVVGTPVRPLVTFERAAKALQRRSIAVVGAHNAQRMEGKQSTSSPAL